MGWVPLHPSDYGLLANLNKAKAEGWVPQEENNPYAALDTRLNSPSHYKSPSPVTPSFNPIKEVPVRIPCLGPTEPTYQEKQMDLTVARGNFNEAKQKLEFAVKNMGYDTKSWLK